MVCIASSIEFDVGCWWYSVHSSSFQWMVRATVIGFVGFGNVLPRCSRYMGPEIAARNFGDVYRYNLLQVVAEQMGLDTSNNASLWKDRAMIELNVAVLHSFKVCGVALSL